MARRIRLTRPELKRQRDALTRYERFLPMLQLKQQQLQMQVQDAERRRAEAAREGDAVRQRVRLYEAVLRDPAGVDVEGLSRPKEVRTRPDNVAGVGVPAFESVTFEQASYSLFGTPPWVDRALADLRRMNEHLARAEVLQRRRDLLQAALTKVLQRVNLFEKVLIPAALDLVRRIRIQLGEEMTAAVVRAKLAKDRLQEQEQPTDLPESGQTVEATT